MLLPLNGHTVIEEVLSRCKRIPGVDQVVCAIPYEYLNKELTDVALMHGTVWHGPERDVLTRYQQAAKFVGADIIVRVTGDCPLLSPDLCGHLLDKFKGSGADYASNITEPRMFPQGYDCEVFTRETLKRAVGPDEDVTTWMRSDPSVKRFHVTSPWKMEGRLTLDTEDDYKTICAYFGHAPYYVKKAA